MDTLNIPIEVEGFSNGVSVNVGNPHIVFFGNNIDKVNLHQIIYLYKLMKFAVIAIP